MYRLLLTPIHDVKPTTIHIMWVKFSPSNTLDHICSLIPMDSASCNGMLCNMLINDSNFVCPYNIFSAFGQYTKPLAFIDETCNESIKAVCCGTSPR